MCLDAHIKLGETHTPVLCEEAREVAVLAGGSLVKFCWSAFVPA